MLRLEADEVVELVGPFRAAHPQAVSCGHTIDRGEVLYEVRSTSGAVGMACSACVTDIGRRCSVVDLPL